MLIEHSPHPSRLARCCSALAERNIDLLLLTPGADMLYLTGFEHGHAAERLLAFFLRADGSSGWICPIMNAPQVQAHALPKQTLMPWTDAETFLPLLQQVSAGAKTIAFDDEARSAFLQDLVSLAPAARVLKSSSILRHHRMRKDTAELAALRSAAATVDLTIPDAMSLCQPGRTEAEVDQLLRQALLARSPESSVAFTIVASGPNGALPHHETSRRRIEKGDVVIVDYGTRRSGYHSDITVTCAVGQPADAEARKVYRIVWEAQQAAIAAIKPGVECQAVDLAARQVIEKAGFGDFFLHRTGHGLGLQVHEPPYMVAGNRDVLEPGMTFSIEPGIYLPNRFGVRLEIIVACGETGAELINTPRPPELPLVE